MKNTHLLLFITLFSALLMPVVSSHPVLSDDFVALGKGCTTAYYIDEDCDGYGVGTGYVLGPDADDTDSQVNTLATVEAKYGSMTSGNYLDNIKSYLCTVRGYCNIQDVYFISPDGDDSTGVVNDITKPFLSIGYGVGPGVKSAGLGAGDLVLYRGGIYTQSSSAISFHYGPEGTEGYPIIIMSFPGELAILAFEGNKIAIGGESSPNIKERFIVDTFQAGYEPPGVGQGLVCPRVNHLTVRYVEFLYHWQGTRCQYSVTNTLFEHNVVHHNTGGGNHLNYWGGSNCYNQVFKDNIFYANVADTDYQLFHWNYLNAGENCVGTIDNLTWDGNIFHSGRKNGLDLMNGPFTNVRIENNLFFNNGGVDLMFYTYSSTCPGEAQASVVNNHFWKGSDPGPYGGVDPEPYYFMLISNEVDDDPHSVELRNNIFHAYNSYMIKSDQDNQISNSVIGNNVFYRDNGNTVARVNGIDYSFEEFENNWVSVTGNLYSNPLFEDVSVSYNLNPENFNLDLTSNSPAIDFGAPISGLTDDLRGDPRDSQPDAGCYEYGSQAPPSGWTLTQLQDGTGSNKLELIFIPSGFTESQSSIFEAEVANNLNQLWQNNFFSDFRQRFDVYRVDDQYDSDGGLKTDTDIESLIDTYDTCGFGDSGTCRKIHIVIENEWSYYDFTEDNFVRLRLPASSDSTLAHEISVHVLGNLLPYGGPLMKDEYINAGSCSLNNYTYKFINAHDRDSNEKWSDLVSTEPFLGSAYCPHFYRPTENSIARDTSADQHCDPVGYRAAEIGLAKRTQDGSLYSETTPPVVSVSGVSEGTNHFNSTTITVDATDSSGIDRVEFYLSIDGQEFRSVGIDRTEPYSHFLDLTLYPGTEYYLRIYVFDEAWNMFGHPDSESQLGPIYHGALPDDLVLHLDFEEGSGSTVLDSSGNGNDGTITNSAYTTDSARGSHALDLDSGYVTIPDSQSMDFDKSRGTIELWAKPINPSSGSYQLLAIDSSYEIEFNMQGDGDLFYYPWVDDPSYKNLNLVTNPLTPDEWQHVAVTWDYSTKEARLYINGAELTPSIENVPTYWNTIASTGDWFFGGSTVKSEFMNGLIDEVRVYSRALTSQEVLQHYHAQDYHRADTSEPFGCIDMTELSAFIELWFAGSQDVSMPELMGAIRLWKAGTGC